MSNPLSGLKIEKWYHGMVAAGAGVLILSLSIGYSAWALVGMGIMVFGFGEWINHRKKSMFDGRGILSWTERDPSIFGLLLDAIGVAFFLLGAYRLI